MVTDRLIEFIHRLWNCSRPIAIVMNIMAINTMNGLVYVFNTGTNIQIAPETKVDAKMTRTDVDVVIDNRLKRRHRPIRYSKQNHNVE